MGLKCLYFRDTQHLTSMYIHCHVTNYSEQVMIFNNTSARVIHSVVRKVG